MRVLRRFALAVALLAVVVAGCTPPDDPAPARPSTKAPQDQEPQAPPSKWLVLGDSPRVVATPANLWTAAFEEALGWSPQVDGSSPRGAESLYSTVAPAVVVVRTATGHATGFVVSSDGEVITNYHVVRRGAFYDSSSNASRVLLHVGIWNEQDGMVLDREPRPAWILAVDESRDLALLRIERPEDASGLPFLRVGVDPKAGQEVAVVGHPASGLLWSLRRCEVSALGEVPRDLVDLRLPLLAASPDNRHAVEETLGLVEPRLLVLSSCLVNPGDAGAPLVAEDGTVVGVTFGAPSDATLSSFSFHMAASELRTFLGTTQRSPLLLVPDMWALGTHVLMPRTDILVAGSEGPQQVLFDLDGDTPPDLVRSRSLGELVADRKFDAEAAIHVDSWGRLAFYDRDNDGHIDLIVEDYDADEEAEREYVRETSGGWSVQERGGPWFDPADMPDPALRARLIELMKVVEAAVSRS